MDRIEKVELIVDAGEYTGSFVKLQPITEGGSADSSPFVKISHMTIGKFNIADGTAIGPTNDITSSFTISGSGASIEAPVYSFKLAGGGVLAYKSQPGGSFVAP